MNIIHFKKNDILKIVVIVVCIIFLTTFFLQRYTKKVSPKIMDIAEAKLEKFTNNFLSNNIGYSILNNKNLENILVINKNNKGEILYVDYNLDKAYEALQIITDVIYELFNNLENGYFENIKSDDFHSTKEGLSLELPMFITSSSPLFSSFGPKIYVRIDFLSSILTNIKSKITDYGFNNALVELYVTINITELISTPVSEKELAFEYDVLVASKVINGRVPEFYGGTITTDDNISNNLRNNNGLEN